MPQPGLNPASLPQLPVCTESLATHWHSVALTVTGTHCQWRSVCRLCSLARRQSARLCQWHWQARVALPCTYIGATVTMNVTAARGGQKRKLGITRRTMPICILAMTAIPQGEVSEETKWPRG